MCYTKHFLKTNPIRFENRNIHEIYDDDTYTIYK